MNKVVILLVLVVILAILDFSIFYIITFRSANVISEVNMSDVEENQSIDIKESCKLSFPFYCSVWKIVQEMNRITIQIGNPTNIDYTVKELMIGDCLLDQGNFYLAAKTAKGITVSCPLVVGGVFDKEIFGVYRNVSGGADSNFSGRVVKKISG